MNDPLEPLKRLIDRLPMGRLAASSDLALAGLLIAVVVMMVVPLPPFLLDFLIALNLALSLGLLLVALYVTDASRLAALPSLLLIATLFRLALNVSTTRLVLLHGDAGRIVEAFGRVVVAGNVVVGGVIFLVLALVQFIVIAKGSERVAEVAARFTLDALPGKQMSIDADLRAGSLSLEQAQERRRSLERESQLYGALDGAMKFVKGDAIAGLVIVAINIVGGLAVGVLQRGMSFGAAATHYTVLTVGDGLAAQLPSLLVSTTAGLVVTRVPGDDPAGDLGSDITSQLRAQPRALMLTGGLLGLLACMPGLPALPFLAMGAVAVMAGLGRRDASGRPARTPSPVDGDDSALTLRNAPAVRIEVGSAMHAAIASETPASVSAMRARLFGDLGLRVPEIAVEEAPRLGARRYAIVLGAIRAGSGDLPDASHWIDAPVADLRPFGIEATAFADLAWCDESDAGRAATAGYRTGGVTAFLVDRVEVVLRANAEEYVGVQEARDLVDALEATHPALVAEVLPRVLSLAQVAEVLRRLVREEVSVRDLRGIFEALAAGSQLERDPVALTEVVRAHLRRQLTASVAGERTSLPVYTLSQRVEDAFRAAARYSPPGQPVALAPDVASDLLDQLRALEGTGRDVTAPRPVLVTAQDLRRHVRATIEYDLPRLKVLSYQDLMPTLVLRNIGTVT